MQFDKYYDEMKVNERELFLKHSHIFPEESTQELSREKAMESLVP